MSFKFDSLMTILNKLDQGEKTTVSSLMDDLEVAERTVHRYINSLIAAGFPVNYDHRTASYVFEEGYTLRKPSFSTEENLTFGLAKRLLRNHGPSLEANLERIREKVAIPAKDMSTHLLITPEPLPLDVGERLALLHRAATNFQRVELVYEALSTGDAERRTVDPYYLFYRDGFWQLRGFCHLRREFRTFGLDRMTSLTPLDEYFLPEEISFESELSGVFWVYDGDEPTEVVLHFDQEIRRSVERARWHRTQVCRDLADGRLELTMTTNGIEGIKQWIYRWLPHVEVVAPDSLRDLVARELEAALGTHRRT